MGDNPQMSHKCCPYCQGKISYLRKLILLDITYAKSCPHCNKNIKLKHSGYKIGIIILLIVFVSVFLSYWYELNWPVIVVAIAYALFNIIGTYFSEILPAEKEDKDGDEHN